MPPEGDLDALTYPPIDALNQASRHAQRLPAAIGWRPRRADGDSQ
jgi:hypothetical protein